MTSSFPTEPRVSRTIDQLEAFVWSSRYHLAIAAFVVVYLVPAPYAAVHLDLARDIYTALRVAQGEKFPLLGPILASTLHLGPIWYYLLALPLLLGNSW